VIVHAYEEYGDACVERLQGMFAFALWDDRRKRLLLARDRVGIKPLYFANTSRALVFGSEIKALLADPSVERTVEPAAIDRFLTYYYLPGSMTMLAGVYKLEPGHYLTLEGRRQTIVRYWDLQFSTPLQATSLAESAERLRSLLQATVKSHMISDVPVGVLLSGGVDSTGILQMASARAGQALHSFTVGFAGSDVPDERPFARLAAQRYGSIHHETTLSAEQFRDLLPIYAAHMEEPVCEPPAIALYAVARMAREQNVKVLLSGEGADEAFAGYPEYRNLVVLEAMKDMGRSTRPLLAAAFGAAGRLGWARGTHYQALAGKNFDDYYFSRTSTPLSAFNRAKDSLYGPAMKRAMRVSNTASDAVTRTLLASVKGQAQLNRMLYLDTRTWLPDDLLIKADKMTMAASVELRVPFLDHHMLEFAASLPTSHKASGNSLKRVLKAALAPLIPKEILHRKKAGFPVPYTRWMRQELRDYVRDTVLASGSLATHYFDKQILSKMLDAFDGGDDSAKEVFGLLALNLWRDHAVPGVDVETSGKLAA
jgi:asparagine synthase (glutamine-hydrolysing)